MQPDQAIAAQMRLAVAPVGAVRVLGPVQTGEQQGMYPPEAARRGGEPGQGPARGLELRMVEQPCQHAATGQPPVRVDGVPAAVRRLQGPALRMRDELAAGIEVAPEALGHEHLPARRQRAAVDQHVRVRPHPRDRIGIEIVGQRRPLEEQRAHTPSGQGGEQVGQHLLVAQLPHRGLARLVADRADELGRPVGAVRQPLVEQRHDAVMAGPAEERLDADSRRPGHRHGPASQHGGEESVDLHGIDVDRPRAVEARAHGQHRRRTSIRYASNADHAVNRRSRHRRRRRSTTGRRRRQPWATRGATP